MKDDLSCESKFYVKNKVLVRVLTGTHYIMNEADINTLEEHF